MASQPTLTVYATGIVDEHWGEHVHAALFDDNRIWEVSLMADEEAEGVWSGEIITGMSIERIRTAIEAITESGEIDITREVSPQALPGAASSSSTAVTIVDAYRHGRIKRLTLHQLPAALQYINTLDREYFQCDSEDYVEAYGGPYETAMASIWESVYAIDDPADAHYATASVMRWWTQRTQWQFDQYLLSQAAERGCSPRSLRTSITNRLKRDLSEGVLCLRVPSNVLPKLLQGDGVLRNRFTIADYDPRRAQTELFLHGIPPHTRGEDRMVYGYIAGGNTSLQSAQFYGDILLVLQPTMAATTTWTAGDSLIVSDTIGRLGIRYGLASSLLQPSPYSVHVPQRDAMIDFRKQSLLWHGKRGHETEYVETQFHRAPTMSDVHTIVYQSNGVSDEESTRICQLLQNWCSQHGTAFHPVNNGQYSYEFNKHTIHRELGSIGNVPTLASAYGPQLKNALI